jgi:adenylate kinase
MVRNRIRQDDCKNGFLFDGFPRTLAQAETLDKISAVDAVINIDVPSERLISRISGRRMCPDCGAAYHVSTYAGETCSCGGKLYQRDDDREETVRNASSFYERSTKPLNDYYAEKGLLATVNGDADMDTGTAGILSALSK